MRSLSHRERKRGGDSVTQSRAVVFDCKAVAEEFLAAARAELKSYPFRPTLAILRRGDDPASLAYEKLLLADAAQVGAEVRLVRVEGTAPHLSSGHPLPQGEVELNRAIDALNGDPGVHGVMLLSPLRCALPDYEFANLIVPAKDIEGRHAVNLGYLDQYKRFLDEAKGVKCVVPATAKAVVKLLQHYGFPRPGAFAVVVNDSDVVGRPLGTMLKNLGATVLNCHVGTARQTLAGAAAMADLVVTAVPDPAFRLDPSWVRPGAAVVDVSYEGNLDYEATARRAGWITPAKGGAGVGRVTRAMIFVNLSYCCRRFFVENSAVEA